MRNKLVFVFVLLSAFALSLGAQEEDPIEAKKDIQEAAMHLAHGLERIESGFYEVIVTAGEFSLKRIPNRGEILSDSIPVALVEILLKAGGWNFGSNPASKLILRDLAKLPSALIKTGLGIELGGTGRNFDSVKLAAALAKVAVKGTVLVYLLKNDVALNAAQAERDALALVPDAADKLKAAETTLLEVTLAAMKAAGSASNYPGDFVTRLIILPNNDLQDEKSSLSYSDYVKSNLNVGWILGWIYRSAMQEMPKVYICAKIGGFLDKGTLSFRGQQYGINLNQRVGNLVFWVSNSLLGAGMLPTNGLRDNAALIESLPSAVAFGGSFVTSLSAGTLSYIVNTYIMATIGRIIPDAINVFVEEFGAPIAFGIASALYLVRHRHTLAQYRHVPNNLLILANPF